MREKSSVAVPGRRRPARHFGDGVFLVVLSTFVAWSLRVVFVGFDTLSALALAGIRNEVLRAVPSSDP